jgi:hypothetical protein
MKILKKIVAVKHKIKQGYMLAEEEFKKELEATEAAEVIVPDETIAQIKKEIEDFKNETNK